ncbi:glycosyltransferase [Asticcacaulis sp. AC402]|uniref:glycosyltransferase n=1 Tax=Asticcacaulis sp. AC402 TaxID=1282361 RepID=UPI0003C40161|nr:glycosyltransferase [Asticcacaulis sp. AC402]ESQ73899.1 hypothetical protein ABAC402_16760 [Asticcacaulis sp. AC402]
MAVDAIVRGLKAVKSRLLALAEPLIRSLEPEPGAKEIATVHALIEDLRQAEAVTQGQLARRIADLLESGPKKASLAKLAIVDHPLAQAAFGEVFTRDHIQLLIDLANAAKEAGTPEFETGFHRILATRQPDFYWPQYRLAVFELERGRPDLALPRLCKVTEAEPGFFWGWYHRASAENAVLGAEASLSALRKAMETANEPSLHLDVQAFTIMAGLPWSDEIGDLLNRILSYRVFSDDDLSRVTKALAGAVTRGEAMAPEPLMPALAADLAEAGNGGAIVNWWPVHVLVALAATAACSPHAGDLLRQAVLAVRVATSRGSAWEIFAGYLYAPAEATVRRLAAVARTPEITAQIMELAETCLIEFDGGTITESLLDLLAAEDLSPLQTRRVARLRIGALTRRGATAEIAAATAGMGRAELEADTGLLFADIRARLALADGSGSDSGSGLGLVREIEAILVMVEEPGRLADPDRARVGRMLDEGVQKAFASLYDVAKARGLNGDERLEAHDWRSHLQRVAAIVARLEAVKHRPAERIPLLRPKVVILTSPYLPQVRHYRAEQMAELLQVLEIDHEVHDLNDLTADQARRICADASVVVFQRQPATPFVLGLMAAMRSLGSKILYDIDDLIFDTAHFPPPLSDYEGNIDRATYVHLVFDCALFSEALNFADEIIVSTMSLRDRVTEVLRDDKPIHLRRNFAGAEVQRAATRNAAVERDGNTVRLFYGSGTKAHKSYFIHTVIPALVEVLKSHANARLALVGYFPELPLFDAVRDRVDVLPPAMTFADFLDLMAQHDISIAPLDLSEATDAKSELKWFEAAAVGLASVVSPTRNYCETIEDGVHALFADDQRQWQTALSRLIADATLRRDLVARSQAVIAERYCAEHWAGELRDSGALTVDPVHLMPPDLMPPDLMPGRGKTRLLVANTYFWPQSIGGATRIVETYVDDLLQRYSEDYDVFVLCAQGEPDADSDYQCETFWYGSALVTRINVPARDWSDPFDDKVEALITELIKRWQIDVAHLHSIQILTASVARALKAAGVPVLLTLHDGWWLSEHQFLVDDSGQPFKPNAQGTEIHSSFTRRMTTQARMRRRRDLGAMLKTIDQVVAVSEAFAQVYHDAGFPKVGVHENGVVPVKIEFERHRPQGRVRVGFIGGRSEHKGYGLLHRAVSKGGLPNIDLVVVDHGQPYGFEREEALGDSRLITLGKVPQSRVAELYTRFDVLAAPSIWPESYGLVTREARFAGLPVLVSDAGDLARGIEDGLDGWIVPAHDEAALCAMLARLNAEPGLADIRPRIPKVVTVSQAVDDLVVRLRQLMSARARG